MKHTKKALAMLLALVMLLALLSVTAFAADTGKITIENAQNGKTYKLYKVFDATYSGGHDATGKPNVVAYTIDGGNQWYALVNAADSPFTLTQVLNTTTYNVDLKEGTEAAAVAAWFKEKLAASTTITEAGSKTADSGTVTFTGLADGYYFISSEAGTTVTLTNVTGNDRTVIDKTLTPGWGDDATSGKFVKVGDGWAKNNTANVGDTLEYKIVVNSAVNYAGTDKITQYVIKDEQAAAIEADFNTMVVKVNGTVQPNGWNEIANSIIGNSTAISKADADWYVEKDATNDHIFYIRINWQNADGTFKFTKDDGKPNAIEITYSATLKNVTGLTYNEPGNANTATLGYRVGSTDTFDTTASTVHTTTFSMLIHKVKTGTNDGLAGAEFKVYKNGDTNALSFYPDMNYEGVYYVANEVNKNSGHVDNTATATDTVVTPENGRIVIRGLAGGTYELEETKAPAGYNRITARITNTTELKGTNATTDLTLAGTPKLTLEKLCLTKVENSSGTVLPETGSMGTTLLITLGALAVIGTGLLLVTNKRISKENI